MPRGKFSIAIAWLVLGLIAFQFSTEASAQKAEVPAAAAIEKSTQEVALLFKNEIQAAVTDVQKNKLAQQLISVATDTKDDLPGKYALLRAALDLAASTSNLDLGVTVIKHIDGTFVVNRHDLTITFLGKLATSNPDEQVVSKIVDHCLATQQELIGQDEQLVRHIVRYRDVALSVLEPGEQDEEIARVKEQSTYAETTSRAFLDLKADRNNRKANQIVGLYMLASNEKTPEAIRLFLKSDKAVGDLAVSTENLEVALTVIKHIDGTFVVNRHDLTITFLRKLATSNPDEQVVSKIVDHCLATQLELIGIDEQAVRHISRYRELLLSILESGNEISRVKERSTYAQTTARAFLDLKTDPSNGHTNQLCGLHKLRSNDLPEALSHFLKSDNKIFCRAAELEQQTPTSFDAEIELAEAWLETKNPHASLRANYWLAKASKRLHEFSGLTRVRNQAALTGLTKRVEELSSMVMDATVLGELFSLDATIEARLNYDGNVIRLVFWGNQFTDGELVHIKGLKKLKELFVVAKHLTDDGLKHLKGLTSLEVLWLVGTRISDTGLVHLKELKSLEQLNLNSTMVTDAGLLYLKGLTNLTHLSLENTLITDAGLEHLVGLSNLEFLHLGGNPITGSGLVHLKRLKNLNTLNLESTDITDAGLEHLKALTKLQSLDISGTEITDAGLVHLKGLTSLEQLDLNYNRGVTGAGLVHLKALTNLETLELPYGSTDDNLVNLKGLTKLTRLSVSGDGITDVGLTCLKALTKLQSLDISYTEITDAGLENLKGLKNLNTLNLESTDITDAGLEHLKALTKLQSLRITYTEITGAGLENLKGLKNLNALYLSPAMVTDAGLVRLKDMTNLTHIGLTNLDVTDARLVHLKGLTKLRRLDLMATQISDTGLVHLKGLTNLETLDLRDNEITGTGLVYLKELKNLEYLWLSETQISDAGLVHLTGLTKLTHIDLTDTNVTDAGVADLQKALPNCEIRH